MDTTILKEIGLTPNEIKVYTALLELGSTTTGALIKKTTLHVARVYDSLNRLAEKGLVKYIIKANRKYFEAINPEQLIMFLKEKEEKLQNIMPALKSLQIIKDGEQEANIYEGIKGVKSVLDLVLKVLKKGNTYYVLGAPRKANETLEGFFLESHRQRIKRKINLKIIYHHDARKYGKIREKMLYTHVRYLPKGIMTPSWIEIFNDYVAIYLITHNPIVFVIRNKDVAKSYLEYFNLIWRISKK